MLPTLQVRFRMNSNASRACRSSGKLKATKLKSRQRRRIDDGIPLDGGVGRNVQDEMMGYVIHDSLCRAGPTGGREASLGGGGGAQNIIW